MKEENYSRQRRGGRWGALTRIVAVSVAAVAVGGFPGAGGVRGMKPSNRTLVTTKDGGELVWKFEAGGYYVDSSPALGNDGTTVYVGSDDGYLYAVDAATGVQKWKFETGSGVNS